MPKKELNQMTIEELRKQAKTIKTISWFLLITLLVFFGLLIYQSFSESETQTAVVIPIALLPVVFILAGSYKKIKTEIGQRTKTEKPD